MSSQQCVRCQKTSQTGNKRSHSNIASKRRFKPNLQTKRMDGRKVRICAKCVKTLAHQESKA